MSFLSIVHLQLGMFMINWVLFNSLTLKPPKYQNLNNYKMVFFIKDNGPTICVKVMGDKYGQMDPSMKECGVKTWLMAKAA